GREKRRADVALARVGQDRDDALAGVFGALADRDRAPERGAAGDAGQHALAGGAEVSGLDRVVVADRDDLVDDLAVQNGRDEAGADALDAVRSGAAAAEDR